LRRDGVITLAAATTVWFLLDTHIMAIRVLAFAGSLRQESYNKKLIKIAVKGARDAGADVTLIDLKDYPLPVYDEDIEQQGMPSNVLKLKELFLSHQGLLLSCPEYNSSITGVLKNVIDWVSRPMPNQPDLACFNDKIGALMSASPSWRGGLRGLVHVRSILSNINVLLIPQQVTLSKAHEAFNPEGSLKDPKQQESVEKLGAMVAQMLKKFY
jgi:chromate reductase, NAD(P)H dehydrogenase (quinone)